MSTQALFKDKDLLVQIVVVIDIIFIGVSHVSIFIIPIFVVFLSIILVVSVLTLRQRKRGRNKLSYRIVFDVLVSNLDDGREININFSRTSQDESFKRLFR